jgi:hypothetical protein
MLADERDGESVLGGGGFRGRSHVEDRRGTYTHAESTAEVVEDDPGAGVACVIHLDCWLGVVLNARQKLVVRPARRGARESCEGKESERNLLMEIPDGDG